MEAKKKSNKKHCKICKFIRQRMDQFMCNCEESPFYNAIIFSAAPCHFFEREDENDE